MKITDHNVIVPFEPYVIIIENESEHECIQEGVRLLKKARSDLAKNHPTVEKHHDELYIIADNFLKMTRDR